MRLNDCGCCEDEKVEGVHNDPGLSEITVRVADFGGFKRGMHEALGRAKPLAKLTTRDDADPALAIIDAWATALDVLTFYNDRIANESYLRTATEPRSMREFARETGYLPAPATAALADLAFTVQNVDSVRIDVGTKVQSQPGQDELPQVFETLETITGRPELNRMPVRHYEPDPLVGTNGAEFAGAGLDLKVGDQLLFVEKAAVNGTGQNANFVVARVLKVERNLARGTTVVGWDYHLSLGAFPQAYVLRQKAAAFGYNALDWNLLPKDKTGLPKSEEWAEKNLSGSTLDLDGLYPAFVTYGWIVVKKGDGSTQKLISLANVTEGVVTRFLMSGKVTSLLLNWPGLGEFSPRDAVVLGGSEPLTVAPRPIRADFGLPDGFVVPYMGGAVDLALPVELEEGRSLLVVGKRPRAHFPSYTIYKRSDGASLEIPEGPETFRLDAAPVLLDGLDYRFAVLRDDGTSGTIESAIDDLDFVPALETDPADKSERTEVDDKGAAKIKNVYDRPSTVVYGNVARASHGETKNEIIGSGNAAASFQKFALSNAPLTYLAAATETGRQGTLEIRVEDVLWHETGTLLDQGPRDRAYTARENEDGKTEATFGNGVQGARLPTGTENVAARYRVGAGLAGRVRKGQLNMLLTRPLGVSEVVNPLPATGGSAAETPDAIGSNIPRSVLTLGRVVSLSDFSDAAVRLPDIAKAQAALLWRGDARIVFLTVSGPDGAEADVAAVAASLDVQRDTRQTVVVMQAEKLVFRTRIEVIVREDYLAEDVLNEVRTVLIDTFGFDRRAFAEAVTVSEIDAAVHTVAGVRAANVTALYTDAPGMNDVLRIQPARYDGELRPAQFLLIDPKGIELTEVPRDV